MGGGGDVKTGAEEEEEEQKGCEIRGSGERGRRDGKSGGDVR